MLIIRMAQYGAKWYYIFAVMKITGDGLDIEIYNVKTITPTLP